MSDVPRARPGGHQGGEDSVEVRERALIWAIQNGQPDAWRDLLQPYQRRLIGICRRLVGPQDVEDCVQEAFVRIIEGLAGFDGRARFSTWVYRVAMNVCLSRARAEKVRRHASLDASAEADRSGGQRRPVLDRASEARQRELQAGERIELQERREQVARALGRLSPEQRIILVLRDVEGMDYEQVAEVLGVPVGTVKSRLFRARAALRAEIEAEEKNRTRE